MLAGFYHVAGMEQEKTYPCPQYPMDITNDPIKYLLVSKFTISIPNRVFTRRISGTHVVPMMFQISMLTAAKHHQIHHRTSAAQENIQLWKYLHTIMAAQCLHHICQRFMHSWCASATKPSQKTKNNNQKAYIYNSLHWCA